MTLSNNFGTARWSKMKWNKNELDVELKHHFVGGAQVMLCILNMYYLGSQLEHEVGGRARVFCHLIHVILVAAVVSGIGHRRALELGQALRVLRLGSGVVGTQASGLRIREFMVLGCFEPLDGGRRKSGRPKLVQSLDELGVLLPKHLW
jgi:hypothetical protein